jgi:protein-arginine kinase activator protein McsA
VDNNALNKEFLKKVRESDKLKNITNNKLDSEIYFTSISQMEDFYSSILDEVKRLTEGKSADVIEQELNTKLSDLIKEEKYEEAAQLRDYMIFNKIKRK